MNFTREKEKIMIYGKKIGPYVLNSHDIGNLIELSDELIDELLNAHLHITTTLSASVILFDSISFLSFYSRRLKTHSQLAHNPWFQNNVILTIESSS